MNSARYMGGSFYTKDLKTLLFTPLNREEYELFENAVIRAETVASRTLFERELLRIVEYIERLGR